MDGIPLAQSAWRVLRRGEPASALELQNGVPVEQDIGEGELIVRIKSAALNPMYAFYGRLFPWSHPFPLRSSAKLMGWLPNFLAERPSTPEWDFSGGYRGRIRVSFLTNI